jgi:hypothetical protein
MDDIVVVHVCPPIPLRCFDWCAYYDGYEEDGSYGWGATKEEAIKDLTQDER